MLVRTQWQDSQLQDTRWTYCDFSHASLDAADCANAVLSGCNAHGWSEQHTRWEGAVRDTQPTDPLLWEAEHWQPPAHLRTALPKEAV